YLTTLSSMWTAVANVADLMQITDLYQDGQECVAPIPELMPLPCCHPCSLLPDPALKGAASSWPSALPEKSERSMPPADQGARHPGAPTRDAAVLTLPPLAPAPAKTTASVGASARGDSTAP